jgi:hypothetical protein
MDSESYEKARMTFTSAGLAMIARDKIHADSIVCLV